MINKDLRTQFVWFIALWGILLSSLALSWWANAAVHYGYDLFYDVYEIGAHIDKFAPQNQFILGLDQLSKQEHVSLFNQISAAVHSHGSGLADIQFKVNGVVKPLLHRAEVVHLQDVANLIDTLRAAAIFILLVTALLCAYLFKTKRKPQFKVQLICLSLMVAFLLAMVLVIGPKEVFYQMHIWVFPDGHQWFFYYQESLMSTMMKAPDLFGGIAIAIVTGALILFGLLLLLFTYLFKSLQFK